MDFMKMEGDLREGASFSNKEKNSVARHKVVGCVHSYERIQVAMATAFIFFGFVVEGRCVPPYIWNP